MRKARVQDKDMSVLREGESAHKQHKSNRGSLKDYSLSHYVRLEWDLNDEAIRDRIFKLSIDEKTVLLDAEEVLRLLRWV